MKSKSNFLTNYWWVILVVVFLLLRKKKSSTEEEVTKEDKTPIDKRTKGVVRFGDVGTEVETLQKWINKHITPDISVDGDYGKQTGTALSTIIKNDGQQGNSSVKWNKDKTQVHGVYTPWLYKWVGKPKGSKPTSWDDVDFPWYLQPW